MPHDWFEIDTFVYITFNSLVWEFLFASYNPGPRGSLGATPFQFPCLGVSFCFTLRDIFNGSWRKNFQFPCLGVSFCFAFIETRLGDKVLITLSIPLSGSFFLLRDTSARDCQERICRAPLSIPLSGSFFLLLTVL